MIGVFIWAIKDVFGLVVIGLYMLFCVAYLTRLWWRR
jgi:hypothetical protein